MKRSSVTAIFLSCIFTAPGIAGIIVDQSFTPPVDEFDLINDCCAFTGETYTAGLTGALAGVSLDVSEYSQYNFPLDVQIRTVCGGLPTTTILGETTTTAFSSNNVIVFPQAISQVAGVQYAIVVDFLGAAPEGPGQGVGSWAGATGNLYPGGMIVSSEDYGVTWPISYAGDASDFITYVNTPIPEPSSPLLPGLATVLIIAMRRWHNRNPRVLNFIKRAGCAKDHFCNMA
jgi:hypothetical protein